MSAQSTAARTAEVTPLHVVQPGDLAHSEAITRFAGYEGIVVGAAAMYTGAAQILNELFEREVLPLGGARH